MYLPTQFGVDEHGLIAIFRFFIWSSTIVYTATKPNKRPEYIEVKWLNN